MGFNPRQIARIGRRLYERRRAEFEVHNPGKYVLIDVSGKYRAQREDFLRQAAKRFRDTLALDSENAVAHVTLFIEGRSVKLPNNYNIVKYRILL